ncbi:MAG: hypothetical protein CME66_06520 [Halobacteriovoraceae bacterium]|nr:hypothetical protein [Halobacteriovoraceae bacterium]|tara:strand:+ start:908 stop:1324 length:417 start_codon:yes stop_codon:yes gene_type:complete
MKTLITTLLLFTSLSSYSSTELQELAINRFEELREINTHLLADNSKRNFLQYIKSYIESNRPLEGFKIDMDTFVVGNSLNNNPMLTTFHTVFAYSSDGGVCRFDHTTPLSQIEFFKSECYYGNGKRVNLPDGLIRVDF